MSTKRGYLRILLVSIIGHFIFFGSSHAQGYNWDKTCRVGFNYGVGNVQNFPFKSQSYIHDSKFYKLQYNRTLFKQRKWTYALNLEPALYISNHIELSDANLKEQNMASGLVSNTTTINEWVVNIGFQIQYQILKYSNVYFLVSVGPSYNNRETKRLNRGFAFSDIVGFGLNWKMCSIIVDFRFSLRHVSNAGLNFPNRGYNSSAFEIGFSIPI